MTCTQPWVIASYVLVHANSVCAEVLDATDFSFALTVLSYLGYFALTCVFEFPFVFLAVGGERRKARVVRALGLTLVLNLATHPLICLVFVNHARGLTFGEFTLAAEGFAFALEMLIVSLVFRQRAIPAAFWIFVANFASWTAGSFL